MYRIRIVIFEVMNRPITYLNATGRHRAENARHATIIKAWVGLARTVNHDRAGRTLMPGAARYRFRPVDHHHHLTGAPEGALFYFTADSPGLRRASASGELTGTSTRRRSSDLVAWISSGAQYTCRRVGNSALVTRPQSSH